MPIELVWLGGIVVIVVGILMFALIRRRKPAEPPHLR